MAEAFSYLDGLNALPGVRAAFLERVPDVDVDGDRDEVLARLRARHAAEAEAIFGVGDWWRAEQVHGREVAVVDRPDSGVCAGADGLVTDRPGCLLGIYVADCAPVWLADRATGAVGLLHSGKKGTELGILDAGLARMAERFGTRPGDVVGVLGPCIRPPHYEVDFAASIRAQAEAAGVGTFRDCGLDTAADPERYYSYRMERGRTGRMLALIMRSGPA